MPLTPLPAAPSIFDTENFPAEATAWVAHWTETTMPELVRGAWQHKDAPSLLADTAFSYTAAPGKLPVAAGDRITTAQGFSYDVAASAATDHHITTAGGVKLKALDRLGVLSPRQFGAKVDGVTDDTAAVQACATYCALTGYEFRLNRGTTRVTAPIKFGASIITDWAAVVNRTVPIGFEALRDVTVVDANRIAYRGCDFSSESGAVLLADWLPGTPQPVIEYNLHKDSGLSSLDGLTIARPGWVDANGRITHKTLETLDVSNNLFGLGWGHQSLRKVSNIRGYGLGKGVLVGLSAYWANIQNVFAWGCGDAFHLPEFNAGQATNLEAWYCKRGLIVSGDGMTLQMNAQQVVEELTIQACDSCVVMPGYYEDTSAEVAILGDGNGKQAVTLGYDLGGVAQVVGLTIIGVRVSGTPQRGTKKAFRFYGVSGGTLIGCRVRGRASEADTYSTALLISTDMAEEAGLPIERFGRSQKGILNGPINFGNDSGLIKQVRVIRLGSFAYGSVPAGGVVSKSIDITDVGVPSWNAAVVDVAIEGGGSDLINLRGLMTDSNTIQVRIGNPTAAAISFTASLIVTITLADYAENVVVV